MPKFFRPTVCLLLLCLLLFSCAQAEELTAFIPVRGGTVGIRASVIDDEYWFFLPSGTDIARIAVTSQDGSVIPHANALSEESGVFSAVCGDLTLHFMRSENIRSLFLISSDPENEGREYIDGSELHSTFTTGSLLMVDEDSSVSHAEKIRKLRGRGNGTWGWQKKPYQIKLDDRVDLLDTGDPAEKARTWVLLALATDSTYLHDRITFDLAKELGDKTVSRSEHINLYYDGEYRGLYLLCEKTEIGAGRIDEMDYDNIIESLFEHSGRSDLETLPFSQAENAYGNTFHFTENLVEPRDPASGAFLLEMESHRTLTDPCYFTISNESTFASKNPEKASEAMMRYVSERLEEAWRTVENGGVNPDNQRTLADDFDVEAFARSIALSELSGNLDSYIYSSTCFILPAGEQRFSPGPPWDYDLAYRYRSDGNTGLRVRIGWVPSFMGCADMRKAIQDLCTEKLIPTVNDVLLGEQQGVCLRPIDDYAAEINAARLMNEKIWHTQQDSRLVYAASFEEEIALLKQYLAERSEWFFGLVAEWDTGSQSVEIWADAAYANVDNDVSIGVYPWSGMEISSCEWMQLTEATEEEYAVYQMDLVLSVLDSYSFSAPAITVNGAPVEAVEVDDGTYSVSFTFEDPSYRPVDAYGEDIGMIYDYDVYVRLYPEVAEMCDYDPELVLDYFLDEGMYEGHQGNAFFSPSDMLIANPYLEEFLGVDWWLYYQEYLAYGYSEWMLPVNARFSLNVIP